MLDADRPFLSVNALETETALAEMESLEALLKDELDFESSDRVLFYEFLANLSVKAKRDPLEIWRQESAQIQVLKKFWKELGTDVSLFGVRISPSGEIPNQANWFEVRFEPSVTLPKAHHFVQIIYRRSRREEVFEFVKQFDGFLTRLLTSLEAVH